MKKSSGFRGNTSIPVDDPGFNRLVKKYERLIRLMALDYLCAGILDPEDLLQEGLHALYRVYESWHSKGDLDLVVRTAVRNAFRNALRGATRVRVRERAYAEVYSPGDFHEVTSPLGFVSPEREVAGREYVGLLRSRLDETEARLLQELLHPGDYKLWAGLPRLQGLAEVLGIPYPVVIQKVGTLRNKAVDVAREQGYSLSGVL